VEICAILRHDKNAKKVNPLQGDIFSPAAGFLFAENYLNI
jgi:hypothetical protein